MGAEQFGPQYFGMRVSLMRKVIIFSHTITN